MQPNTIGLALQDNPLGQLAWIGDQFISCKPRSHSGANTCVDRHQGPAHKLAYRHRYLTTTRSSDQSRCIISLLVFCPRLLHITRTRLAWHRSIARRRLMRRYCSAPSSTTLASGRKNLSPESETWSCIAVSRVAHNALRDFRLMFAQIIRAVDTFPGLRTLPLWLKT